MTAFGTINYGIGLPVDLLLLTFKAGIWKEKDIVLYSKRYIAFSNH